jgi:hypothetical protein
MARAKATAHTELDRLRQDAAREATGVREAEAALHRAEADRRALDREMEAAYFDGRDGQARQQAKQRATLDDCAHQAELRLSAQRRRAQHAAEAVVRFEAEHARELLAEMKPTAEQTARELHAALEHVVRLDRQWQRERQATDQLVNRVGSARHDCPASAHPFFPRSPASGTCSPGAARCPRICRIGAVTRFSRASSGSVAC